MSRFDADAIRPQYVGLPMFRLDRRLWLVTVATSAALIGAMLAAMRAGVG